MNIQFYSDLHIEFEEFEATIEKADVIIFAGDVGVGHLHNSSDYHIGTCRVVCNPRGYSDEFNPEFDTEKVIEIG